MPKLRFMRRGWRRQKPRACFERVRNMTHHQIHTAAPKDEASDVEAFDDERAFSTRPADGADNLVLRMMSGADIDLCNLDPATIDLNDFAFGVARETRWNGQTRVMDEDEHAMVVGQHLHICDLIYGEMFPDAGPAERLSNKVHDAAETLVKDLCAPVKIWIGPGRYRVLEHTVDRGFRVSIGLGAETPPEWERRRKIVDRRAAFNEALHFMGWDLDFTIKECGRHELWMPIFDMGIWTPRQARITFLERVSELQAQMKDEQSAGF